MSVVFMPDKETKVETLKNVEAAVDGMKKSLGSVVEAAVRGNPKAVDSESAVEGLVSTGVVDNTNEGPKI